MTKDNSGIRRWTIRSIFVLPVLFCAVGWLVSAHYFITVSYFPRGQGVLFGTYSGIAYLWFRPSNGVSHGWHISCSRNAGWTYWPPKDLNLFLGFGHFYEKGDPFWGTMRSYTFPYLLPLVIFSAFLFFVWRRTRPKLSPATAFPVGGAERELDIR